MFIRNFDRYGYALHSPFSLLELSITGRAISVNRESRSNVRPDRENEARSIQKCRVFGDRLRADKSNQTGRVLQKILIVSCSFVLCLLAHLELRDELT